MTALLEVEGLSKRFGGVMAVDSCSFSVAEGTITALIGPNGSGKTTAFNIITGYLKPDSGAVGFSGHRVKKPSPARLYRQGLSRTFQQARIFPEMSVVENLVIAAGYSWRDLVGARLTRTERSQATEMLEEFRLSGLAERRPRAPYGQRKLLELPRF
jgi:ABC-type branched-subunit amino acid transport system ATPase component